jgi:Arc/MetJ-type ribon-helix-helix transcriptional regulator
MPVWESRIIELCARMFGVTVRSRLDQLVLFCMVLFVLGVTCFVRWGPPGLALPFGLLALAVAGARQVAAAREAVWRAACFPLDARRQQPDLYSGRVLATTALSLLLLALAVDQVRRGRFADASDVVARIHADLLRPEERQLLEAVRAMISIGLGSSDRAAKQAVRALPTGSEDLDTTLGRTLLADAWDDPDRLHAIQAAWARAGVTRGPLAKLAALTRVRIDTSALEHVAAQEARDLADEARAIGDEMLAAELEARGRPTAYR